MEKQKFTFTIIQPATINYSGSLDVQATSKEEALKMILDATDLNDLDPDYSSEADDEGADFAEHVIVFDQDGDCVYDEDGVHLDNED